jgi:hypothetical protein
MKCEIFSAVVFKPGRGDLMISCCETHNWHFEASPLVHFCCPIGHGEAIYEAMQAATEQAAHPPLPQAQPHLENISEAFLPLFVPLSSYRNRPPERP